MESSKKNIGAIIGATALLVGGVLLVTACGSTSPATSHESMPSMTPPAHSSGMAGMPMASGNGLSRSVNGYTLHLIKPEMPGMKGMAAPLQFTITKSGRPVTAFDPEQTKLMHFYLIRSDLTGFQHLHPTMNAEGVWSITPATLAAGSYRIYVQFVPHASSTGEALVLSAPLSMAGSGAQMMKPIPAEATAATVDGYTVTLSGTPKAGVESELELTVTKGGNPVTNLQPYLATFAHVTAIRAGNLAFAHLHPDGGPATGNGGPTLIAHADLPEAGKYRMFIQFQTDGILHTAAVTITVSS
jgi:hypothetical protein